MYKLLKSFSFLAIIVLLSGSCAKPTQTPTALQLKIVNGSGNPVSSASVTLYKTQDDLTKNNNIQDVQISDNNGSLLFDNLSPQIYFFNVYRGTDCATNAFTETKSTTLIAEQVNAQTVTVNQIGQINFKNLSGTDPYEVSINGTFWKTVPAAATYPTNVKVGSYLIHVKQSGAATPVEKDYNINVASCQVLDVSFP